MLITLLLLILLLFQTIGAGLFFLKAFKTSNEYDIISTAFIGSFFIMIQLGFIHFLLPIQWLSVIIVSILSLIGFITSYKKIKRPILDKKSIGLLFLISFYFLTKGSLTPSWVDSGLYHAQVIKWYNNYPIVKGLANLFCGYGLNSNFHLFASLSTYQWMGTNFPNIGIVFFELLFSFYLIQKGKEKPILYLILIWFLVAFWGWESSPSPDIIITILIVLIGLLIIKQNTTIEENILLALCCIYSVTIKQSSFIFVFLIPFIFIQKNLNKRTILLLLTTGSVVFLIWVIRNYTLTGYLLYPITSLDLFNPKHQVPKNIIHHWLQQVTLFAKLPTENFINVQGQNFYNWIPTWFNLHRKTDQLLILVTLVNLFLAIFKQKKENRVLFITIIISLTFWLFKTPTIRFAYGYMFLLIIINFSDLFLKIQKKVLSIVLSIFLLISTFYSISYKKFNNLISPQDYDANSLSKIIFNGNTFYIPNGGNCKNSPLPCLYRDPNEGIKMFSDKINDGFYQTVPSKIDIDKRGY